MKCPECNQEGSHAPGCPRRFREHPEDIPTAEKRREREFEREGKE